MSPVFADFVDGRSARIQRAEVSLEDGLRIAAPEAPVRHWRLDDLRSPRDVPPAGGLVLTSVSEPLSRLYLPDDDMVRRMRDSAPHLHRPPPVRGLRRVGLWGMGAIASVALILFVLVPILADQLATILPAQGEQALGDATLEQVRAALDDGGIGGLSICSDREGLAALDGIRARVTGDLALPYELTVTVLDHELVNAFALPGGHIVFFRGLIDAARSPDEVAAVFAHELGHVVARDPVRIALRSAGSIGVLGLLFGDFAGGAAVLFLTERLIQAAYTREAEAAADLFAHATLIEAGIRPDALADLFATLAEDGGDVPGLVEHFLSHPALGDRIAGARAAAEAADAAFTPALDPAGWAALRQICD
jgi:Zn-dependent protease with chaperone function